MRRGQESNDKNWIRNNSPQKNYTESAHMRCLWHVERMEDERYPRMALQAKIQGTDQEEGADRLGKERIQKILREGRIGWNGVSAVAGD
jgi:hypothetical protein